MVEAGREPGGGLHGGAAVWLPAASALAIVVVGIVLTIEAAAKVAV